eukprot:2298866-Lingulodinium_polyedra.AAC.2
MPGIEVAARPHLYPSADLADLGSEGAARKCGRPVRVAVAQHQDRLDAQDAVTLPGLPKGLPLAVPFAGARAGWPHGPPAELCPVLAKGAGQTRGRLPAAALYAKCLYDNCAR